jgi:hypothetical protein
VSKRENEGAAERVKGARERANVAKMYQGSLFACYDTLHWIKAGIEFVGE